MNMLFIIFCGLLVATSAAPHRFGRNFPFDDDSSFDDIFDDYSLNMGHFWRNLNAQMMTLHERLGEMSKHLPHVSTTEVVDGNEYKLTMGLSGFKEDDITVKAKQGTIVVEAHNKGNNVISVQSLPANVGANGSWVYENNVLTITFPVDKTKPSNRIGSNTVIVNDSTNVINVNGNRRVIGHKEPANLDGHSKNLKDQVELIHY